MHVDAGVKAMQVHNQPGTLDRKKTCVMMLPKRAVCWEWDISAEHQEGIARVLGALLLGSWKLCVWH